MLSIKARELSYMQITYAEKIRFIESVSINYFSKIDNSIA